jgi:prophage regulatory protein
MARISQPAMRPAKQSAEIIEQEFLKFGRGTRSDLRPCGEPERILRRTEVEQVTGLPRATIYDKISRGLFPRPIKLGERSVGWLEREIVVWQRARIAERDGRKPKLPVCGPNL